MLPLPALPPDARARMERNLEWSDARAYHFDVHQDARQLIVIEEQAASADECAALCRIYRTHASLSAAKQASNVLTSPVLFLNHLRNNGELDAWRQCQRLKLRALQRARATFGLDELYPDGDVINEMRPGDVHVEHADNADYVCRAHGDHRWDGGDCSQGQWIPMPRRWWRDISAVLYLDEDFEGGALAFGQYGLRVQPKPGTLVMFPSNRHFLHEVKPVTSGERHALAMWFTRSWDKMSF